MSLLQEIESFLDRTGMPPTTFGRRAIRDPRLVGDLQRGRSPGRVTRARVRAFLSAETGK